MITLADAIRAQFERDHPHGKNTLLCDQCRRRKDRTDFRETPWHGRAADCKRCEGLTYWDEQSIRDRWLLAQERAKVRMLVRHVQRLRLQRLIPRDAMAFQTWAGDALRVLPEPERRRKRARLTLQMERTR